MELQKYKIITKINAGVLGASQKQHIFYNSPELTPLRLYDSCN